MEIYKSNKNTLPGSNFAEVKNAAMVEYAAIKRKTRRKPYVRSAYFNKDKVFLELFWNHLYEKLNHRDKMRRLKYFSCAIDLIKNSRITPESKENINRNSEILHRFIGKTKKGELFIVQIKQEKRNDQKWLVSVFPLAK